MLPSPHYKNYNASTIEPLIVLYSVLAERHMKFRVLFVQWHRTYMVCGTMHGWT